MDSDSHNPVDPPEAPKPIDAVYAFLVDLPAGGEGVGGMQLSSGASIPFFCASTMALPKMEAYAQAMADQMGMVLKLVKFTNRELIKTIEKRLVQPPPPPGLRLVEEGPK